MLYRWCLSCCHARYSGQPTIKLVRNAENFGMCKNWNSLILKATGEYILKLDADDLIPPNYMEAVMAVFNKHKNVDIVATAFGTQLAAEGQSPRNRRQAHAELEEGIVKKQAFNDL